jgi:hypothetical protein
MGTSLDRLKNLEEASKRESEAIAKMHRSVLEELRQKLLDLQSGVLSSISNDMASFREGLSQSASGNRTAFKTELDRSVGEAQRWSRRGLALWSWSGWLLIVWSLLLILGIGATHYVSGLARETWDEYARAKAEAAQLEASRTVVTMDQRRYVRIDPAATFTGMDGHTYARVQQATNGSWYVLLGER